jgi:hypothetical protein
VTGRKPWVAVALSVAIPGLGHVYAGTFGLALAFGLADRLLPPALELLAGAGGLSVKSLAITKLCLPLATRLVAALHAVDRVRLNAPQAAPGAYGFFAVGWFVAAFALGQVTGRFVTTVPLTSGGHGLRPSDRVLTTRLGEASRPQPGALAVYFEDWPDGGAANPLVPLLRQVKVGRVTDAGALAFEVLGQTIPLGDYGGVPLGVLSAPSGQRLDWDRIGQSPTP